MEPPVHAQQQILSRQLTSEQRRRIIAVAASMLTAVFHITKDRVAYQDLGPEHFNNRDKVRAANRLVKRLEDLGFAVEARPTTALVSI
jgi:hypothetical protein